MHPNTHVHTDKTRSHIGSNIRRMKVVNRKLFVLRVETVCPLDPQMRFCHAERNYHDKNRHQS